MVDQCLQNCKRKAKNRNLKIRDIVMSSASRKLLDNETKKNDKQEEKTMAERTCPFLTEKPGYFWSSEMWCVQCDRRIYSDDRQYKDYCNDYASSYEKCPYFDASRRR